MRFRHQFEAFLRSFVTRIHVRVILARQPPVSLLDLFGLGVGLSRVFRNSPAWPSSSLPIFLNFRMPLLENGLKELISIKRFREYLSVLSV